MYRFFQDFTSVDRFTLSLQCFGETLQCPHCAKSNQLVSHGIIYKQRSMHEREAVGKRVLCSNRYQRTGCGRTIQLYIAHIIPSLQYSATHLFVFLSSLLMNFSLGDAYEAATGQTESRNAWRWLQKLIFRLTDFRCFLENPLALVQCFFKGKNRRIGILLSTLKTLFSQLPHCPCAHYQLLQQCAFL